MAVRVPIHTVRFTERVELLDNLGEEIRPKRTENKPLSTYRFVPDDVF